MLTLTNGCQFTLLDGRVTIYRSPQSYYSIQDPALISGLYGKVKLTETQAIKVATSAIRKLGYESDVFNANSQPVVTCPEQVGTNYIPRYRVRWLDPRFDRLSEGDVTTPALLDIEVNAENGRIEMVVNNSRDTKRPSPQVDVVPALVHPKSSSNELHKAPTQPVNASYAAAFVNAILPQLSEFITMADLKNCVPVTNLSVVTNYICRISDNQPIAQLYLMNGDRFNYEHGHFEAFYAHDAMDKFPETGKAANFLGHINMTTNEAILLCSQIIRKMGYTNKLSVPIIGYVPGVGSTVCTRYSYYWRHPDNNFPYASFEIDMETRSVKSIFLRDSAFEKQPPQINAPIQ